MLLFSAIVLGGILFTGNASGPALNGAGDKTGSPNSSGTCMTCHSGGTFAPVVTIDVQDSQGATVTAVEGDSTYSIIVNINATSGTPSRYGFQATIYDDSSNTTVGTLVNAPSGVRYNTVGIALAEHSTPSTGSSFTFNWRAPSALAPGNSNNSITIYAYGNCVNFNGGTTGDAAAGDSYQLTLNPATVGVKQTELAAMVDLNLFPNPVVNELNVRLDSKEAAQYNLSVFNNAGQAVRQQSLQAGDNQLSMDVSDLSAGVYRLMIQDEQGRRMTRNFVKF